MKDVDRGDDYDHDEDEDEDYADEDEDEDVLQVAAHCAGSGRSVGRRP